MGVLAKAARRHDRRGTVMSTTIAERRQVWHSLSKQDKQQRLQSMRHRQQRQVEFELLRLHAHLR
jgi:hypothetical protein